MVSEVGVFWADTIFEKNKFKHKNNFNIVMWWMNEWMNEWMNVYFLLIEKTLLWLRKGWCKELKIQWMQLDR